MNELKIKYFGLVAETLGTSEDFISPCPENVSDLRTALNRKISMREINFTIAVNQNIANNDIPINPNDEVAILPPFAGG